MAEPTGATGGERGSGPATAVAVEPPGAASGDTYRALFERNPTPAFVVDAETLRFLAVNAAAERLYGYSADEFAALTIFDIRPPEDREHVLQLVASLSAGATSVGEVRHLRRDGTSFFMHAEVAEVAYGGRRAWLASVRDVSNLRATERELRASEARLRTLVERSPYSIQVLGTDGRVVFGNPAWERLFGVTVEDICDYSLLTDPQLESLGVLPLVRRAFDGEAVVLPPTVYVPDRGERKGQNLWTQATLYPVFDDEQRVQNVILMHEDATDRVRAERARDAERARLAAVLQQMPSAVLLAEAPSGRIVLGNKQVERILQHPIRYSESVAAYARDWIGYRRDGSPLQADEWPLARALLRGEFAHGEEIVVGLPDGARRVIHSSSAPIRDADGAIVAAVAVFDDVTDAVAMRRDLQIQRDLYRRLLDAQSRLGEGVCVLEGQKFAYVNDAYCELTGYTREELLALPDVDALLPPEDRSTLVDRMRRRAKGEPVPDHYEATIVRKDGSRRSVEMAVKAVPSGEGEAQVIGIARDVTARRHAEAHVAELRAELARAERLAALGTLVSGVAHEVRTPLTYMNNAANVLAARMERLRRGEPIDAESTADLAVAIREGVDRVNRLVEDLRRFTRLGVRVERRSTALESIAADALGLFRATHRSDAVVEARLVPGPPVLADAAQIQQVVLNLLQNAAEASRAAGRPVRLAVEPDPRGVRLVVADEGVGMTPEVQARMWDPLYTTKPEGTGLGLSIVKRILADHGAHVACESAPGRGTTFTVVFRAADAAESAPANP